MRHVLLEDFKDDNFHNAKDTSSSKACLDGIPQWLYLLKCKYENESNDAKPNPMEINQTKKTHKFLKIIDQPKVKPS